MWIVILQFDQVVVIFQQREKKVRKKRRGQFLQRKENTKRNLNNHQMMRVNMSNIKLKNTRKELLI